MRGLLQAVSEELGHPVAHEWQKAGLAIPRHHFLPERIWLDDGNGGYAPCDRQEDPERWFAAAYANVPVVTQVNDGEDPGDGDVWPSSSASAPAIVFRMLEDLDVQDVEVVYEVGTGSGLNTAYLCHRLGDTNVVSSEIDKAMADHARITLNAAGFRPTLICDDGAEGYAPRAPYNRLMATCSVRRIPAAWINQTKPGGVILTPWDNPWFCWGLLRLTVGESDTAVGRFSPHSAFMLMRGQRTELRIFRDVVKDEHQPYESKTALSPWSATGDDWDAAFTIGLRLGDVWHTWQDEPVDGVATRLWVATTDATSWAAVDYDGRQKDQFAVYQHGRRRLWDEVEAAYGWWVTNDRPGPERFGLTVTACGIHHAWLDAPVNAWVI